MIERGACVGEGRASAGRGAISVMSFCSLKESQGRTDDKYSFSGPIL